MMRRLRRAAGFALVPLSLLPLVAVAPIVAPTVAQRIGELRAQPAEHSQITASLAILTPAAFPAIGPVRR